MRIGVVIPHFDPHRGGAEHCTFQFVERLLARGHEVHVVGREFSAAAERLPVVGHCLDKSRSRIAFAAAAEQTLRSLRLDVVHDMGSGWYCDIFESHDGSRLASWERKLAALPAWARPLKRLAMRLLPRYREFRALFSRQLAEPGPVVLALSRMVADDYQRFHGIDPRRIRLVYNGVDVERFSPAHRAEHRDATRRALGLNNDEALFLFVGHDFQRKGLATALRAIGRLTRQGEPVRLAVVGGKHWARHLRLAQRCGAGHAVSFLGSVRDPVPYYAAADAYVLPTFYDPCSLGVLEAAASGLPSVTTRFNGAGELLTDGLDGYLLDDPADDAALAERLQRLLDPVLRRRMGEAARHLALKHTLDRNCDEIVALYHELAGIRADRTRAA